MSCWNRSFNKYALVSTLALGLGAEARADIQGIVVDPCHPQPAEATSFKLNAQDQMQIFFEGATPSLTYQIQASANLSGWRTVATTTADAFGTFSFVDTQTATQSAQFYRAVAPEPQNCPVTTTTTSAPSDPALQAMADQVQSIWGPELDKFHAAGTEAQFVSVLSSLRLTPLEQNISALLNGKPQGENLRQLMISLNRVPFSIGAAKHVTGLLTTPTTGIGATSANINAAMSTLQAAVTASTDPDGVQRSFLVEMMVAIPNSQSKLKSYSTLQLSNDTPGASSTLTANGKRLFRVELFRAYLFTNPDLATELMPFANQILAALHNPQDKAPILQELTVRHPSLLMNYLASRPAIAVARPLQ